MKIILASESPGRKNILEKAGYVFEVVPSNFEEDMTLPLSPHELTLYLSQGKARSVAEKYTDAIVIGADTIGVFKGEILGKPYTPEKSNEMLSMLSGAVHTMLTGLTIIDTQNKKEITRSVETKVRFRKLPMEEIIAYTNSGEGLNKSAGYASQLNGKKFIEEIEGSVTNITGLPIEDVMEIFKEMGVV